MSATTTTNTTKPKQRNCVARPEVSDCVAVGDPPEFGSGNSPHHPEILRV